MSKSRDLCISNTIYLSFSPILIASRFLGLAPFSINSNGSVRMLKLSAIYQTYSVLLLIIVASLTFSRMVIEIQTADDNSFRMTATTSEYVTCADTILVEIIISLGILNITLRWKSFYAFLNYISENDSVINIQDGHKTRSITVYGLVIIIGTIILLFSFDLYVRYMSADMLHNNSFFIMNYLPYQLSFLIGVLVKCVYAHMGYNIKIRLEAIKNSLKNVNFKAKQQIQRGPCTTPETNVTPAKNSVFTRTQIILKNLDRSTKVSDLRPVQYEYDREPSYLSENDIVLQFIKAYLIIGDAVNAINDCFGHIVLVILIASLLHLTVTPYYFIVELTGKSDAAVLILQFWWFLTHCFHLVLIVEPCNLCLEEAKLINGFVCQILSSGCAPNYQKQLELFFAQLQYRPIEYSAFGLGRIDRSLITGMAGAVTVYLVTIIQFRNSASG